MPRHLLTVFSTFAVGGPQVRFCRLVAALGPGYRHSIIAMDGALDCAERLPPGIAVDFPTLDSRKGDTGGTVRRIRAVLARLDPDMLLTHNWGCIEWAMANRFPARRHIHVEDGFGPDEQEAQHPRRVWMRRLFLRRATVVVPSARLHGIASRIWRLPKAQLRFIPNGVDLARFAAVQPASGSGSGEVTIGTVAALRPEKNLSRLLRAFAVLPPGPARARLIVAGSGPEEEALRRLAAQLGIADRVTFPGHCSDVAGLLAHCDIFALSSDTEQMPLSVLEAMAAGLPVAATDVGDLRSMLAAENAGFITPRDDALLSAALGVLVGDEALRHRAGAANRLRAAQAFGENAMFEAWRGLLEGEPGGDARQAASRRHAPVGS